MTAFIAVSFNLLLNAMASFGVTLLCVYALIAALRIGPSRGRLLLLLLPFVKLGVDLVRGIPGDSFLWVNLNGARQELGTFMFGFGVRPPFTPMFRGLLAANVHAQHYSQSAADLLFRALSMKISPALPGLIVTALLAVAAGRLALRFVQLARFVGTSQRWLASATLLERRRAGWRSVRVFVSTTYAGTPFAAGFLQPYVLLPARPFFALDAGARQAVLAHELAHSARHDSSLLLALGLISDLFWFLPGMAGLLTRCSRDLELSADAHALRSGATPAGLAQALLAMSEAVHRPSPVAALFGAKRPLLSERVQRLLDPEPDRSRFLYRHVAARVVLLALFVPFVLASVFLGNFSQ